MKQIKINFSHPGRGLYMVKFTAIENVYFSGMDNILTHTAVIEKTGTGFNCVSIDGKPAETRRPAKTPKTAAKYAYFVKF